MNETTQRCLSWFGPCLAASLLAFAANPSPAMADETAFDRYIKHRDPAYAWKVAKTVEGNPSRTLIVHLTSQAWRTKEDVDRPVWEHWLTVVRPSKVTSNKAFLMVGGSANDRPMPEQVAPHIALIAEATNSVVAELRMVPNQPLVFHGDGKPRKEDDLIAYCWDQYLKTGDATWLPRFPMVKSVVRAMDCIQELMKGEQGGKVAIDQFVVGGGSKRGWTTWMTAAMDKRVAAIVPIVIDVVNVEPSMLHHAAVYGFWAKAIGNYYEHGIMQRLDHPRLKEIYRLTDPWFYRDRLTMPKYIVNASGDQFFVPDSSQFYFDGLKGEKHLRYVPNADHSLRGSDAYSGIIAFYQMVLQGKGRPEFSWSFQKNGSIRVAPATPPKEVRLWQATNPKARDFRLMTIGKAYQSRDLKADDKGTYTATVDTPKEGWTAFFVELTYDTGTAFPLKLTTAVRVLPDKLPYADLDPRKVPYEGALPGKP